MTSFLNEAGVAAAVRKLILEGDGEEYPSDAEAEQSCRYLAEIAITAYLATVPDARAAALDEAAEVANDHAKAWGPAMASPAIAIATAILSLKDHPHVK